MKKILLMAIATTAVVFASCKQDIDSDNALGQTLATQELVIKLDLGEESAASRMTTAPGATGQLKLNDGHIFVINNTGSVTQHVVLDVAAATSATGQTLTTPAASDSRIYILGNIPSTLTPGSISTYDQLRTTVVNITTAGQTDYTKALLANSDGQAVMVTSSGTGTATVTVPISPLYSRLELAQVSGGPNIVSFNVTGVFVDRYYSSFTLTGASSGALTNQTQRSDFTGNIGDTGNWASTGAAGSAVAVAGSGLSWTYHMAADDLPRFIIRLANVVYNDSQGQQHTLEGTRYITVTGYSGNAPTKFERGKIYQIATITFNETNAALTPNPTNVTMNVKTQVVDWVPTPLTPTVG